VSGVGAGVSGFRDGDVVVSQSVKGAYAERAVVAGDGLLLQHIQRGATQMARAERLGQRHLVDQTATRREDRRSGGLGGGFELFI
jgi:hypothetical protein